MKFIRKYILFFIFIIYSCNKHVPPTQINKDSLVNKSINKTLKQLMDSGYIN